MRVNHHHQQQQQKYSGCHSTGVLWIRIVCVHSKLHDFTKIVVNLLVIKITADWRRRFPQMSTVYSVHINVRTTVNGYCMKLLAYLKCCILNVNIRLRKKSNWHSSQLKCRLAIWWRDGRRGMRYIQFSMTEARKITMMIHEI